jgi:hypothetical protein
MANMSPAGSSSAGNAGAPVLDCAMAMTVFAASALAGTTIEAPPGPFTVPPAGPIPAGGGGGGGGAAASSPPLLLQADH